MKLRDYQREAIDSIYSYFEGRSGNPLVVMPTGSGKSVVIAHFLREVLGTWSDQRVLVLTHVKELVEQNADKLLRVWPGAPLGIYSAGLNRRDTEHPILMASIQSVFRRAEILGHRDLILVDEAHLIPKKGQGMYRKLLDAFPGAKVVGFTATAFRTDSGMLHRGKGRIFTDICYETDLLRLIDKGFLCPLVPKQVDAEINVVGVRVRAGEFVAGELEEACMRGDLVKDSVAELVKLGVDRKRWLVFCSGIEHAELVLLELESRGVQTRALFGHTASADRDAAVQDFRSGALRALVNVNVLTTGFDAPETDLMAVLRPTQSPGLFVQMMGRGMRIANGKTDCLVLDFGGNVARHGPINLVRPIAGSKGQTLFKPAPTKVCPECRTILSALIRTCPSCSYEWPKREADHYDRAGTDEIIARDAAYVAPVSHVFYSRHSKPGKPASLKVTYQVGLEQVHEWVCLEHSGYASHKARLWWKRRAGTEAPSTVEAALARTSELREPRYVRVKRDGRYARVVSYAFAEDEQKAEDLDPGQTVGDDGGGVQGRPGVLG